MRHVTGLTQTTDCYHLMGISEPPPSHRVLLMRTHLAGPTALPSRPRAPPPCQMVADMGLFPDLPVCPDIQARSHSSKRKVLYATSNDNESFRLCLRLPRHLGRTRQVPSESASVGGAVQPGRCQPVLHPDCRWLARLARKLPLPPERAHSHDGRVGSDPDGGR